ncbi:MAG: thioredoxin [Enterobacter phage ENC9]|nr:MAG: thioredoxin [Enterobacter phage ENC9]
MFNVQINKGTFRGNDFSGKYVATKTWFPDAVPAHEAHLGDGKVFVMVDGKERGVWVFKSDIEMEGMEVSPLATVESVEEMKQRINKRFTVMNMMTKGIISGNIRSLIISGAAGIGKTYSLDKALKTAHEYGEIVYKSINGKISGIGLYEQLWNNRDANSVLLIDDVDVFSDMDMLNLLKAALDTGETRKVCWSTASAYLDDKNIDKEFEFEGTIVFITNVDIDKELERGSKLAPHLHALVSRSVYLDLGVHSNEEIMVRVEDVILNTNMMQKRGLSDAQTSMALNWMKANVSKLRNVSLRTALYLADFVATDANGWEEIAEVTLLK